MRKLILFQIAFWVCMTSCEYKRTPKLSYSLRDSVLKEYLLTLDSIPYYDTSDINYKILKAYQSNDTSILNGLQLQIRKERQYEPMWQSRDTCLHQIKIEKLGVDEAYRFIFTPAFCSQTINATVTKKGDSISLHFILLQNQYDTSSCKILANYNKKLTQKNWEDLSTRLLFADIWGLKRENGLHGFDGSTMNFIGYKKSDFTINKPDRICFVNRWEFSTLHDALTLILQISGNKKGCYWVE